MQLDRAWIAARIPHQGNMCLLDRIEQWSEQGVRAYASSHRAMDNPLRAHGKLASSCGIEYAAQAMAVHGALLAQQQARPQLGYLASVRGATLHVDRLDDIAGELTIDVTRFSSDGNNVLYDFVVSDQSRTLLEGRAAVIINAGPASADHASLDAPA
jgi:predicted hotdog family 3-hydroxylacyl-ACP dehydratase